MWILFFACAVPPSDSMSANDSDATDSAFTDSGDSSTATTDTETQMDAPTFSVDVAPILLEKCAGCHYSEPEHLGFAGDNVYGLLVNHPAGQLPSMNRVTPGSLDQSYLWHKLEGTQKAVGGKGEPMPSTYGTPITEEERNVFRDWIVGGAQE